MATYHLQGSLGNAFSQVFLYNSNLPVVFFFFFSLTLPVYVFSEILLSFSYNPKLGFPNLNTVSVSVFHFPPSLPFPLFICPSYLLWYWGQSLGPVHARQGVSCGWSFSPLLRGCPVCCRVSGTTLALTTRF